MIKEICDYAQCTGCMACLNVCSKQAIHLKIDKEDVERPEIDVCELRTLPKNLSDEQSSISS